MGFEPVHIAMILLPTHPESSYYITYLYDPSNFISIYNIYFNFWIIIYLLQWLICLLPGCLLVRIASRFLLTCCFLCRSLPCRLFRANIAHILNNSFSGAAVVVNYFTNCRKGHLNVKNLFTWVTSIDFEYSYIIFSFLLPTWTQLSKNLGIPPSLRKSDMSLSKLLVRRRLMLSVFFRYFSIAHRNGPLLCLDHRGMKKLHLRQFIPSDRRPLFPLIYWPHWQVLTSTQISLLIHLIRKLLRLESDCYNVRTHRVIFPHKEPHLSLHDITTSCFYHLIY